MARDFKIKPVINSKNKQISVNLPRKKLPKKLLSEIGSIEKMQIRIEGWW